MRLFFFSGEPSGDLYAHLIIKKIKELEPAVEIFFVGGEELKELDAIRIRDNRDLSVVGFFEGFLKSFSLRRIKEELKREIISLKPDLFLPISFGGLALPLACQLKREGIKTIYLSPPQTWAWGRWRIRYLKKVDKIILFFPFEVKFYERYGIRPLYFGNPLIEILQPIEKRGKERIISFALGSRGDESRRHKPFFLKLSAAMGDRYIKRFLSPERRYEIIAQSDLLVGKFGTVLLESVLLGKPYIGIYFPSLPTLLIGKFLVKRKIFSLPNIILERKVFPEFVRPKIKEVKEKVSEILENREFYEKAGQEVRARLKGKEPTKKIAEEILGTL